MQGLITIDFGNTNPHAGLFQKHKDIWNLIKVCPFNELPVFLDQLQMSPDNSSMVLAEVKSREEELTPFAHQGFLITRVKEYWRGTRFAGMPVNYAKTLGEDRLIQAYYAFKKLKENVLLIDAGTFATMDVITKNGFEGGYIIPGMKNYFETFEKGSLLKAIEIDQNVSAILPHSTTEAMRDSYFAFAALAQKLISEHKLDKVLLSGGQAALWKQIFDHLQLSVVVQQDETLIHWALQYWMTTQIETL
ncbi:MAG: type III pantothenate kinase [Bdellovibrionales bacterium]|nr:type III pantothenate kinase [Bdellovibrionales bacterium]